MIQQMRNNNTCHQVVSLPWYFQVATLAVFQCLGHTFASPSSHLTRQTQYYGKTQRKWLGLQPQNKRTFIFNLITRFLIVKRLTYLKQRDLHITLCPLQIKLIHFCIAETFFCCPFPPTRKTYSTGKTQRESIMLFLKTEIKLYSWVFWNKGITQILYYLKIYVSAVITHQNQVS